MRLLVTSYWKNIYIYKMPYTRSLFLVIFYKFKCLVFFFLLRVYVIFVQIFITLKLKNRMSMWFKNIIEEEMKKKKNNSGYVIVK